MHYWEEERCKIVVGRNSGGTLDITLLQKVMGHYDINLPKRGEALVPSPNLFQHPCLQNENVLLFVMVHLSFSSTLFRHATPP